VGCTVPKNIKGVKAVDGTNLLITSVDMFFRGTVWNTFRPFFGLLFRHLEQFGTLKKGIWNTPSTAKSNVPGAVARKSLPRLCKYFSILHNQPTP
jgi:hypothetical protein